MGLRTAHSSAVLDARFREGGVGVLPRDGYSAEDVKRCSEVIPMAIASRTAFYPTEESHFYPPDPTSRDKWSEEERAEVLAQPILATYMTTRPSRCKMT